MEESKSGPADLQQAVSLFTARKVGLRTVAAVLERFAETADDSPCTVELSPSSWARLKCLHDSAIGAKVFSTVTVSGTVQ